VPMRFTSSAGPRLSKACLSARIDQGPVCGPHPPDDMERSATDWAGGDCGQRVGDLSRLKTEGVWLHDHPSNGVRRDGTAGMHKAEVADFPAASGQDMLAEPAEKRDGVEVGRSWAGTAGCAGGEGDKAVLEAHDAAAGEGDFADIRGEIFAGRMAVGVGLAVDVPGDVPDPWVDVSQESSVLPLLFAESPGEGGEGLDRDKDGGAGGQPSRAVRSKPTAWDDRVHVRVVLERPAPGMEDAGKTGQVGADKALLLSEPFERCCRSLEQSGVGNALMRTDKGA
jgi:hypothetical protein